MTMSYTGTLANIQVVESFLTLCFFLTRKEHTYISPYFHFPSQSKSIKPVSYVSTITLIDNIYNLQKNIRHTHLYLQLANIEVANYFSTDCLFLTRKHHTNIIPYFRYPC